MPRSPRRPPPWLLLLGACSVLACTANDDAETGADDAADTEAVPYDALPEHFLPAALVDGTSITTEACTLSRGTRSTCYRITIRGEPADHDIGPFCPRNIADDASAGGIWIESGVAHDVDGPFIAALATFYNDDAWQLYDPVTGQINVTDTEASCSAAARPDVDPAYNNYCVECSLDYIGGGVATTYLIPVTPVALASPAEIDRMGAVGLALNGGHFDPPAPTDAILAAHTIAAFDDCGGHVNLHAGYHYHAATGCTHEIAQPDEHAPLIGYAMDGYGIHAMVDGDGSEPVDLDDCRGHTDTTRGYHYHVAGAGENMFLGCFHGEQGSRQ